VSACGCWVVVGRGASVRVREGVGLVVVKVAVGGVGGVVRGGVGEARAVEVQGVDLVGGGGGWWWWWWGGGEGFGVGECGWGGREGGVGWSVAGVGEGWGGGAGVGAGGPLREMAGFGLEAAGEGGDAADGAPRAGPSGGELAASGGWFLFLREELPGCGGDAGFGVDCERTCFSPGGGTSLFSGPFGCEVAASAPGG